MKLKKYKIEFDVHVKINRYISADNEIAAKFLAYTQLVKDANKTGSISGEYQNAEVKKVSYIEPISKEFDIFGYDDDD